MAYGADPAGGHCSSHTIYVWPSRELTAQSWHWPASWHEAFQHAAGRIGLAVAMCVLEGRPLCAQQAVLRLSMGTLRISVKRRGTSIFVKVHEFTGPETPGPHTPGPDGGARQPSSVDGLILGLRGSGRRSYLVVFHGYMPPTPTENSLSRVPAVNTPTSAGGILRMPGHPLVSDRRFPEASPVFSAPPIRNGMTEPIQCDSEMDLFARLIGKPGHMRSSSSYLEIGPLYREGGVHLNKEAQFSELLRLPPSLFRTPYCRYMH
jgi:hypothetical protein